MQFITQEILMVMVFVGGTCLGIRALDKFFDQFRPAQSRVATKPAE
jgi:hypothetical protein